jgi:hypothetical protein
MGAEAMTAYQIFISWLILNEIAVLILMRRAGL